MAEDASSGPPDGGAGRAAGAGGGAGARVQLVYPESLAQATLERVLLLMLHARGLTRGPALGSEGPPTPTPERHPIGSPARVETPARLEASARGEAPAPATVREPLPFAVGDHLAGLVPGPDLAGELAALDPGGLDVDATIEAIAAWDRLISWAAAHQSVLLHALAEHEHRHGRGEFADDAVATRLHFTRRAATTLVERAIGLAEHPPVHDLLTTGAIDPHKAGAILATLADVPTELRRSVLDTVLPGAPHTTAPVLRNRIRTAAQALQPALTQARAATEADRRCVRLTPAPDAMAYLTFYLPADHATTALTALGAIADAARTPDDPRTADARRVDALTDLLRAVLDTGRTPTGIDLPTRQHRHPHIQVTIAATTLAGLDDHPADLTGYGPIPAEMARRIAADGTWRRLLLNPDGRVTHRDATTYRPGTDLTATILARDPTCTFPGCRTPSHRCDLDHLTPYTPHRPAAEQTTPENLHPLCRHHHRLKTHTTWTVTRNPDTGTTTWTTPWGRQYLDHPEPHPGTPETGTPRPGAPPTASTSPDPPPTDPEPPPF